MKTEVYNRFQDYDKEHCWQYEIRVQNRNDDLSSIGLDEDTVRLLEPKHFDFEYVDKTDPRTADVSEFIHRHEWLGKMPNRPTHRFIATIEGVIAGTIVMATPNAFSHLLGPDTKNIEKLISRGACVSWSPKNLGSWLIMNSIRWMVKNTEFRLFPAYSDPEAKELGTIYQACNFIYLGQTSGTQKQYFDSNNTQWGWFSDREFRKRGKYAKYATALGISKDEWKTYMGKYTPLWDTMPPGMKDDIKAEEKKYRDSCDERPSMPKHKYVYILGENKRETRDLHKRFCDHNPKLVDLPYPKNRGI
jgi:hypothetical protein